MDRQTDKQRQRDGQTDRGRQMDGQTDRGRLMNGKTNRGYTETYRDRWIDRHSNRDRQAD